MSIIKSALTEEQLSKLKFIDDQIPVFPKRKAGYLAHTMSSDNLKRVVSLLTGGDTADVLKKDMKIYFIPDGMLRMDDYKEYCRQNGYRITSHPKNADVIVGYNIWEDPTLEPDASHLSFKVGHISGRLLEFYTDKNMKLYDLEKYIGQLPSHGERVLFGNNILEPNMQSFYYDTVYYSQHCITDKLMEVVYWKLANQIPVINEEVFVNSLEKMTIDESMYDTIRTMINSSDKNDVIIGFDLMCRCDIMKSAHYLRLLYGEARYTIRIKCSIHTKLASAFLEKIDLFYSLDDAEFIDYLSDKNALTEEVYYSLSRSILKNLVESHNADVSLAKMIKVTYTMLSYEDYILQGKAEQIINTF